MIIAPQKGAQELFLSTPADIAIYGGAAGGGKTFALLLEPLRHINNGKFGAVIFRKNANQIFNEGGLWDSSFEIYPFAGGRPIKTPKPYWRFPSGMKVTFAHLETEKDLLSWQGAQIAMIGFDELTHFTQYQFFYMLSRNRSTCGVKPYVRATTNPDAESWVAEFIKWWIDPETGYPIKERSGQIRYMVREDDKIVWGDTKEELIQRGHKEEDIKSVTFIAATIEDNKILMEKDPGYVANLKALPYVDKERLLKGNWKVKPAAGLYFKRSQVTMVEEIPTDVVKWVRRWDLASTDEKETVDSSFTAGVLMGKRRNGRYIIADVINVRYSAAEVRELIKNTAAADKARFKNVRIIVPQDPGQAGKDQAQSYIKMLAGYNVGVERETGSKIARAEPLAAQWQAGNVDVLVAEWNGDFFTQMEAFPEGKHNDMVDAAAGAFNELERMPTVTVPTGDAAKALLRQSYWLK